MKTLIKQAPVTLTGRHGLPKRCQNDTREQIRLSSKALRRGARPADSCLETRGLCLPSCEYALPLEWVYTGIKQWLSTTRQNRKRHAHSVICTPVRHSTVNDTNFLLKSNQSRITSVLAVMINTRVEINFHIIILDSDFHKKWFTTLCLVIQSVYNHSDWPLCIHTEDKTERRCEDHK